MPIDASRIVFAQREYRQALSEDANVLVRHPLATEFELDTFISKEADAISFGAVVLGLRKLDQWTWVAFVRKEPYPDLEVGQTITIFHNRFGLEAGKNFIVKRLKTESTSLFYELEMYGPQE